MSAFSLMWPPGIQLQMQTALDSLMTNIAGRICTLYFPPTMQPCPSGHIETTAVGFPTTYWSAGNPQWMQTTQIGCTYCGGNGFISVESSGSAIMCVYDKPAMFNQIFPVGNRFAEGQIMTRGFNADLNKVLNCTRMETYLQEGSAHYNFTLDGEPRFPSQLVQDRYWYALWKRV